MAAAAGLALSASNAKTPLLWPVPVREGCTSSFGEFRLTHFHVGVDIRTHQEEGWPVAAVADGKVVRVRREPEGYGRVLYLELADGRTAVYGHLCRYSRELGIEQKLQEACAAKGSSFPGDVVVSPPVAVKAGDIVARSGQLGLGSPHLHFEVRRGDDSCDPFLEGLPLPEGLGAPELEAAAFVPRDATGRVDGSFLSAVVPAVREAPGRYRLARAVRLQGAVDVEVVGRDHLGVPDNSTGLSTLAATLDGSKVFEMDLRCVSLALYKQSPLLFDPDRGIAGAPAVLLRRAEGFAVPGVAGEGLPAAAPGDHVLEVTATSRGGAAALLRGAVQVVPAERPSPLALPGRGFSVLGMEFLPAGLVLRLSRASPKGVTPLLWGGRPVDSVAVEGEGDQLRVLLPVSSAPRRGAVLALGDKLLPGLFAAGPCTLQDGPWSLEVPAGGMGFLESQRGSGSSALVLCGPASARSRATLAYRGAGPAHAGLVFGPERRWVRRLDGKAVPFRGDGLYAVGEDRSSPRWGAVTLATIPHFGGREARVEVTDAGSGPEPYSLRVTLDGKPVYPDWDSDPRQVRLDLTDVPPGRHVLAGSISDRAGNGAALAPQAFIVPAR